MHLVIWIVALCFVALAGWFDWRSRRIPNWLTVPGLLLGLTMNTLSWGWPGIKLSLAGAGLSLGVLLPFVLLRGLGAGDWKLMGALGALLGFPLIVLVLFGTIFVTGLMAAVQITRLNCWGATLRNLIELVKAAVTFKVFPHPKISLDNPGMMSLPFGVAAALATSLCFVAGFALRAF